MTSFSAQVDAWVMETIERQEAVVKEAVQLLFSEVTRLESEGGRLKFDQGFLRASFVVTLDAPVAEVTTKPKDYVELPYGGVNAGLTLANFSVGQTIYGTFTANYARPREYGSRGKPGDAFVRSAAARWQEFIDQASRDLRSRVSQG